MRRVLGGDVREMTPELCPVCGEAIGGLKIHTDKLELLDTVKLVYMKHCLNDPEIGWEELSDKLLNTLCNVMGDKGYQEWLEKVTQ
jgi:hypothetical protein